MSVGSKMTALADGLRTLSGNTGKMTLDGMKFHVDNANEDIDSEAELINQIQLALQGKAAGGGGSGSTEDLTSVLTEQEALISELQEILRGKTQGDTTVGINIDTCTVHLISIGGKIDPIGPIATQVAYNTFENGVVQSKHVLVGGSTYMKFNNVVSGSIFAIDYSSTAAPEDMTFEKATKICNLGASDRYQLIRIDASSGEVATITAIS